MTAGVTIPGSRDVVVNEALEVDVSGSGTVEYMGSPAVESNIAGSRSVPARGGILPFP